MLLSQHKRSAIYIDGCVIPCWFFSLSNFVGTFAFWCHDLNMFLSCVVWLWMTSLNFHCLLLQGCLICLTLALGWACAAYVRYWILINEWNDLWILMFNISWLGFGGLETLFSSCRNREIKRMENEMRRGNDFAFLCHDINELEHSNQVNLPRVTVVMPLKGFGEHNLLNWRSQVRIFRWLFTFFLFG